MNHIKDWLVQLFCKHEYELYGDVKYFDTWTSKEFPSYIKRIYICKKCGHKRETKI